MQVNIRMRGENMWKKCMAALELQAEEDASSSEDAIRSWASGVFNN